MLFAIQLLAIFQSILDIFPFGRVQLFRHKFRDILSLIYLFIFFSFGGGEIDLKSSFSSAVKILASHLRLPNAVNAVHFR